MSLSAKAGSIRESETLKLSSRIENLRKSGKEIINFAVGEPDTAVSQEIIDSTKSALDAGKIKYSNPSGIMELKNRISEDFLRKKLGYSPSEILVANGSKQAIYNALQAICSQGDEVIINNPSWVSFSEQIKLAGSKPVAVETINHQPDVEKIKGAITKKTKAIIINTPNNPTGAVYKKSDLKAIADICADKGIIIISDEAYDLYVYGSSRHISIASLNRDAFDRTITIKSFSKTYGMTGFRIGFAAARKEIIELMGRIQGHTTGNVCTFAQYGAVSALEITAGQLEKIRSTYEKKRDLAYSLARKMFGCTKPEGAFYLFPEIKGDSARFSSGLLEKHGVAVAPGEYFGSKKNIRISYALPENAIREGFERMSKVV